VDGSKLDLSLRRSRTGEPADDVIMKMTDTEGEGEEEEERGKGVAKEESCDPEITSLEDLEVGKVVRGFVKAITDVGVFVRYGCHIFYDLAVDSF
jgi:ribosomal protein S1